MFGRVSGSAYSSLRCQRRFGGYNFRCVPIYRSTASSRRWQTTNPLPNEHEDEQDRDERHDAELDQRDESELSRPQQDRSFPSWFYSTKAQLGVNVLGNPAEVLILPPRQRRNREEEPDEQEKQEILSSGNTANGPSVAESLATESKSISPKDAVENIDLLRQEIEQYGDDISPKEILEYRNLLVKRFNAAQLLYYLHGEGMALDGLNTQKMMQEAGFRRVKDIASHIIASEWGFGLSGDSQPLWKKVQLSMSQDELKLIMSHRSQYLGETARSYGAQIDMFIEDGTIEVTGYSDNAIPVVDAIKALKNEIMVGQYDIPADTIKLFSKEQETSCTEASQENLNSHFQSIANNLARKYDVLILGSPTSFKYLTFNHDIVNIIEREIFAELGQILSKPKLSRLLRLDDDPVSQVPAYPSSLAQLHLNASGLYRNISVDYSLDRLPLAELDDPQTQTIFLARGLDDSGDNTSNLASSTSLRRRVGAIQQSQTAELGQVLFSKHSDALDTTTNETETSGRHYFANEIPYLPQNLARLKTVDLRNDEFTKDLMAGETSLIQLRFKPALPSSDEFVFEVYISRSGDLREDQPNYKILHIKLLLANAEYCVQFPRHAVDVKFGQRNYIDVFPEIQPSKKQTSSIKVQIDQYLQQSFKTSQKLNHFNAMLTLDISSSKVAKRDTPKANMKTRAPGRSKSVTSAKLSAKYILESAEYVDRSIYAPTTSGPFLLEHLTYSPLPCSMSQQPREVLRLCDPPTLCQAAQVFHQSDERESLSTENMHQSHPSRSQPATVKKSSKRIRRFIKTAYGTVAELSEFARDIKTKKPTMRRM